MDYMSQMRNFREKAQETGLALDLRDSTTPRFWFELSMGTIIVPAEKVLGLVTMALELSKGEHDVLLALVALRDSLGDATVIWRKPSHVIDPESGSWITLADWLREQGSAT